MSRPTVTRAMRATLRTILDESARYDGASLQVDKAGMVTAIIDSDLTTLFITAAEVGEGITLAENLLKFLGNVDPTNADYLATIAKLRTDL